MKTKEIIKMKKLLLLLPFTFISCEKDEFIETPLKSKPDVSMVEKFCCDWDAANFEPYVNGICVTEAYFRNSRHCDNSLCVYPNY